MRRITRIRRFPLWAVRRIEMRLRPPLPDDQR